VANHDYIATALADDALTSFTPATVTDAGWLREELEETARRGWANEVGELLPGFTSIAAPVEDSRRGTVGAIGIAGPTERMCNAGRPRVELVDSVLEAARAVSRELVAIPS
jgi:DNA-binding IclR family transcriptional regulator